PACFATSNETAAHACRLGALSCSDATGPEDPSASCLTTREEVCVPEAFCECRGKQLDTACTKPKLEGNTDRIPRFVCTIQLLDGGKACSDASEVYDFSDRLDNGGCKFALSALDLMSLASGDRSHVFNGLDLELANNGCGFKIQVNPDATHMTTIPELGMVRMGASDGPAVLVPIILQFQRIPLVRECPTKPLVPLCAFIEVPDDPMWSCLP
ncbi:MAG: hypothetical protein ABIY55_10600, partial [Kofleriaceae bacterium]